MIMTTPLNHGFTDNLQPFWHIFGAIEDYIGDDELVQFGDTVTQVTAEMLVQGQIAMETHKDIDAFNEPATLRQTYFPSVRFPFLVSV
jgi:hypothetical protein